MTTGSAWYFPVYEGLFRGKHVDVMGSAIWLYGWLIARAHVAQNDGRVRYNHLTAAMDLNVSERTVRRWFDRLRERGYIQIRARRQHDLELLVTNWRPVEELLNDRRQADSDAGATSPMGRASPDKSVQNGHQGGHQNGHQGGQNCQPSITIMLSGYSLRSASAEHACLADVFHALLDELKQTTNRGGTLQAIYVLLFGESQDVPTYGYLAKVAKEVGGAGRLAELLWGLAAKPPTGDILAYIQATEKARKRRNGNGQKPGGLVAALAEWEEDQTNG